MRGIWTIISGLTLIAAFTAHLPAQKDSKTATSAALVLTGAILSKTFADALTISVSTRRIG